jgi:hypothetical protein
MTTHPEMGAWRSIPRLDRLGVISTLLAGTTLAWIYLFRLAGDMTGSSMPMAAIQVRPWEAADFILIFLMWAIMMVGMMVPSAAPTVVIYAAVARKAAGDRTVIPRTAVFISGYVVLWTLYLCRGDPGSMGSRSSCVVVPYDGDDQPRDRVGSPDRCRRLPNHADQACLLETLPFNPALLVGALACRNRGRVSDGAGARSVLRGMLLGVDGAPVPGWRNEPSLDRGHHDVHFCGEGDPCP